MNIVKSPLNYVGGKARLLPQIQPHFPKDVNVFHDVFCGGLNVGANQLQAKKIIANDIDNRVIEVLSLFKQDGKELFLYKLQEIVHIYGLSKFEGSGYLKLRENYNSIEISKRNPYELFALGLYGYNHQFRFNNAGNFNTPHGKNRSGFSETTKQKIVDFCDRLEKLNIQFTSYSFTNYLNHFELNSDDLIYCDPPYLISEAVYNNKGKKDAWTEKVEKEFLEWLDEVAKQCRFALSNVFIHKGMENKLLMDWAKKYKTITLNYDYSNASYNAKNRDKKLKTQEVLVINY